VRLNGFRVDGLAFLADGSLLLTFNRGGHIAGISGKVEDEDIVRFVPTSLGERTAGTFSLYFDGSDVGLTSVDEDLDAFTVLPGGALLISLAGDRTGVPGITGAVDNSDILRFTPSRLGATTAGSWAMYFDGSDVGLTTKDENVDGLSVDVDGRLLLSTSGALATGRLVAANEDVVIFTPSRLGADTAGTFRPRLFVDFSTLGFRGNIKGTALKP
jgi:hypothetical protein